MTRKMTVAGMVVLALMVPAFVPRASADGADGWPLAQWSEWRLRAVPRLELSSGIFLEEGTRPLPGHLSKSSASQLLYQRQAKDRFTTHRFGSTTNVCNPLRFTTSTEAPSRFSTSAAKGFPV